MTATFNLVYGILSVMKDRKGVINMFEKKWALVLIMTVSLVVLGGCAKAQDMAPLDSVPDTTDFLVG